MDSGFLTPVLSLFLPQLMMCPRWLHAMFMGHSTSMAWLVVGIEKHTCWINWQILMTSFSTNQLVRCLTEVKCGREMITKFSVEVGHYLHLHITLTLSSKKSGRRWDNTSFELRIKTLKKRRYTWLYKNIQHNEKTTAVSLHTNTKLGHTYVQPLSVCKSRVMQRSTQTRQKNRHVSRARRLQKGSARGTVLIPEVFSNYSLYSDYRGKKSPIIEDLWKEGR